MIFRRQDECVAGTAVDVRAVPERRRVSRGWHSRLSHKAAVALAVSAWLAALAVPARADVDGDTPSPGSCTYPAIGGFGLDGMAQHYVCDFPLEINNSRHHCVYGGTAATVGANISLLIFSATIATQLGVLEGVCYWACPDGSVAPEPDPVQTWQGSAQSYAPVAPHRRPCTSVAPNPVPPEAPASGVIPQQQPVGAEPGSVT